MWQHMRLQKLLSPTDTSNLQLHTVFSQRSPKTSYMTPTHQVNKKKKKNIYIYIYISIYIKIVKKRRSLKLQGLRTHLPIQDTWVRSLIWDDPICLAAAKPLNHNHWAHAPEQVSLNYRAHAPQLLKPMCIEPVHSNKRSHLKKRKREKSHYNEKPVHLNQRVALTRRK